MDEFAVRYIKKTFFLL